MPAIKAFCFTSITLWILQYIYVFTTKGMHPHWSHLLLGPALWSNFGG